MFFVALEGAFLKSEKTTLMMSSGLLLFGFEFLLEICERKPALLTGGTGVLKMWAGRESMQ